MELLMFTSVSSDHSTKIHKLKSGMYLGRRMCLVNLMMSLLQPKDILKRMDQKHLKGLLLGYAINFPDHNAMFSSQNYVTWICIQCFFTFKTIHTRNAIHFVFGLEFVSFASFRQTITWVPDYVFFIHIVFIM